ncbi:MAG: hypothetical protein QM747_20365 [Nocardioides sp.]
MFTLPLGPVRSGVVESIEFLLETPGEDIPHLNVRPHYKHRGIAKQFEGRTAVRRRPGRRAGRGHQLRGPCAGVLPRRGGARPGSRCHELSGWCAVVLAELERIANHLDVTMKLADAAGLAVATSRFGLHKERVLRLFSQLCEQPVRPRRGGARAGSPGRCRSTWPHVAGRAAPPAARDRAGTSAALEGSASFLDRLRGTGPLAARDRAAVRRARPDRPGQRRRERRTPRPPL